MDLKSIPRTPRPAVPPEHVIRSAPPAPPVSIVPTVDPASLASGEAIIGAIAKADRSKVDPADIARIAWRDDVPAGNAKLSRIAAAVGITPEALRAAALKAS